MRKVMIVDDEALTRYALRKLIEQNFPELEVIQEIDNGIDAEIVAIEKQPDLIFMDVKMPGKTGIEASEEILLLSPKIHIIILTAYDHFSYIQKALEIGVEGYLLKPISKEVVVNKIRDILQRINLIESKEKARKELEKNVDSVIELVERDYIDQIINNIHDQPKMNTYSSFLGYQIAYGYFICLSFEQENSHLYNSNITRERTRNKVMNAIDRYLPFMTTFIQASPRGNCIILFLYDTESTESNQLEESQMIAKHLIHKINIVEQISLKAGIGFSYKKVEELYKSFNEAYLMLNECKTLEVLHIGDYKSEINTIDYKYPIEEIERLKGKLKLGAFEEAKIMTENIMNNILHSSMPINQIKEYLIQYFYDLRQEAIIRNIEISRLNTSLIQQLRKAVLIEEMKNIMFLENQNLLEILFNNMEKEDQRLTKKIYDYIQVRFKKDISLEELAEEINKSSQYTSKIFKDLFGTNFVEYLASLRIEEAKRLLKQSDLHIKEIGKQVGYDDTNYFCRIFKRREGLTPKEYRRK